MRKKTRVTLAVMAVAGCVFATAIPALAGENSKWDEFVSALAKSENSEGWIESLTQGMEADGMSQEEIDQMIEDIMSGAEVSEEEGMEKLTELLGYLAPGPTEEELAAGELNASKNWKEDLEFVLDGKTYDMPVTLNDLQDAGWLLEDPDYIVGSGGTLIGPVSLRSMEYPGESIYKTFCIELGRITNDDEEEKPIADCKAVSVTMKRKSSPEKLLDKYPDVSIAGGITWGDTCEEVEAVLGKPDEQFRADDIGYTVYYYYSSGNSFDSDSKISVTVYDLDGVAEISMTKEVK